MLSMSEDSDKRIKITLKGKTTEDKVRAKIQFIRNSFDPKRQSSFDLAAKNEILFNKMNQIKVNEESQVNDNSESLKNKLSDAIKNYSKEVELKKIEDTKKKEETKTPSKFDFTQAKIRNMNVDKVREKKSEVEIGREKKEEVKKTQVVDQQKKAKSAKFVNNRSFIEKEKIDAEKNKKSSLLDRKNKMFQKYGHIALYEKENEGIVEDLSEIFQSQNQEEITQENIEEDEEKFFGKSLIIKPEGSESNQQEQVKKKIKRIGKKISNYKDLKREVILSNGITVKDLASQMSEKVGDVIKILMKNGVTASINQVIEEDVAELVAELMGHSIKKVKIKTIEEKVEECEEEVNPIEKRIPIITIMGHVDHGKTSLLDTIRNSNIAAEEHSGITQHIGAYTINTKDNHKITFLDTPGHAAFKEMRSRGARVTDIVILVVAGDDGIKPQTIEAIEHVQKAGIPMIVAVNKIDKPDVNIEKVKQDLLKYNVVPEDLGGDVMVVPISAKTSLGIDSLLSAVLLQADLLDIKCDLNCLAIGSVIESKLDKNRGPVATIILKHGRLSIGDIIVSGSSYAKVKIMQDDKGEKIKTTEPGIPVSIIGFNKAPSSGDKVNQIESEESARELIEIREGKIKSGQVKKVFDISSAFNKSSKKEINLIIKADTFGSLEAITGMISTVSHDAFNLNLIGSGIGNVIESDISLAKTTNSIIFGFQISLDPKVRQTVEKGIITVKLSNVIYELMDQIKELIASNLDPVRYEDLIGKAEVKQLFGSKSELIAGCSILSGISLRGCSCKITRNGNFISSSKVRTIKRFKEDVKEVRNGQECGILLDGNSDFQVKDILEFYEERIEPQKLDIF